MINIQKRPEKFHKRYSDRLSLWNCSRHPYIFEFVRQDMIISGVANNGGNIAFSISLFQHPDAIQIAAGDQIFFSPIGDVFNVISSQTVFFFQLIVIDAAFVPNMNNGFVNLSTRKNYFIEIEIDGLNAMTNQTVRFGTARVTPNMKGVARFDVQNYLNNHVVKDNLFSYDQHAWRDPAPFGNFSITYTENWRNNKPSKISDKFTYYFIDSTKYLLEDYGQNLCDFVPLDLDPNAYDTIIPDRAKFLCDFKRPTYFVGYPFSLSFVMTEQLNRRGVQSNEKSYSPNGTLLSNNSFPLTNFIDDDATYRLMLSDQLFNPSNPFPGADVVEVWLRIGDTNIQQQRYSISGYVANNYTANDPVAPPAPGVNSQDVTEHKFVKIVRPCGTKPVFICWRNSKGGFSYWLFENKQEIEYQNSQEGTFISEGDDIEFSNRRKTLTQANQTKIFQLGGIVDIDDFDGIRTVYQSPNVLLLVDQTKLTTEPERAWLSVRPIPKSFKHFTTAETVEFEIQIELPSYYTIPN